MSKYICYTVKAIIIFAGISLYLFKMDPWLCWNFISHMFILFGAFALLRNYHSGSERAAVFSRVLAALFAAMMVIGQNIYNNNDLSGILGSFSGFAENTVKFSGFFLLYYFLFIRLFAWLENASFTPRRNKERGFFTCNKKSFFLQWGVIFIMWLPCLLAYWPGTLPYDAPWQVRQSLNFSDMNMHHPIIHTAFIGIFYRISLAFGNDELLPITYAFGQMIIMSAIFSFVVYYMAKIRLPSWLRFLALAFFALYPFIVIFSIVMSKDPLHGGAVCLFFISLLDAALDAEAFFKSKKKMLLFLVTGFLFTITRNNAYYAFIICIPVFLVFFRRYWHIAIVLFVAVATFTQHYNGFLTTVLHVWKGPAVERYPLIAQQFAHVVLKHEDNLSQKDLSDIYNFLPREAINEYHPRYADPVKNRLNEENVRDTAKLITTWLRIGIKHPICYTSAFLSNGMGFWYIDSHINDPIIMRRYIETSFNTDFDPVFERKSKIPFLMQKYENFAWFIEDITRAPVLVTFMSVAFPFWLLIVTGAILIFKKSRLWITLVPLAALLFTVIIGPLAYGRYIYPIVALYPMIFGLMLIEGQNK